VLTVTSQTLARFAQLLDGNGDGDVFRIALVEQDLSLVPDEVRDGDSTFDHEGRVVLVIEERLAGMMAGMTLALEDSDEGSFLTLTQNDPDAAS